MQNIIGKLLVFNLFLIASCLMCRANFAQAQTPHGGDIGRFAQTTSTPDLVNNRTDFADLGKRGFSGSLGKQSNAFPSPIPNRCALQNLLSAKSNDVNENFLVLIKQQ